MYAVGRSIGPIVLIQLPDCRANFLNDSEELPPIVRPSLTCPTTADLLRLTISSDASSPYDPIFNQTLPSSNPSENWMSAMHQICPIQSYQKLTVLSLSLIFYFIEESCGFGLELESNRS